MFFLPVGSPRFDNALNEGLQLVRWYSREHVILCLLPAFFIAGGIAVFVSQASVMKYLGARANKTLAYGVAAVSGTILAVCSCTVLPLFAGIYKMGAGLGPAIAFLYSGPAISVLAIIMTARILGLEIGIWRAAGAIIFSIVIGLIMHFIFRAEENLKVEAQMALPEPEAGRPLWQTAFFFFLLSGILIFANWAKPMEETGTWHAIFMIKWLITSILSAALGFVLVLWYGCRTWKIILTAAIVTMLHFLFPPEPLIPFAAGVIGLALITATTAGEAEQWFAESWGYAKLIMPLLLGGVFISGLLLGRPGTEGLIPSAWIATSVGGNSLLANFVSSIVGAFMYFATLTEVPIVQGLLGSGMGKGPALGLLLAGPVLSLPSMLVIQSILGTKKTVVFVSLVVIMATITGMLFGAVAR